MGLFKAGIIICQPVSSISDTGFSYDRYAFKPGTNDVHLNEEYFKEFFGHLSNL